MSGNSKLSYLIYDGEQLYDGEISHGEADCIKRLGYMLDQRYVDFIVYAADFGEAQRSGKAIMHDVTKAMVRMAWESGDMPSHAALAQEHVPEARRDDGLWRDVNAEHRTFTLSRGESL